MGCRPRESLQKRIPLSRKDDGAVMKQVNVHCYMRYSSDNYGVNALVFGTPQGQFWFSYKTLVAFSGSTGPLVCIKNYWGPTTGKHLNAIQSDKALRVDQETFDRLYEEAFGNVKS